NAGELRHGAGRSGVPSRSSRRALTAPLNYASLSEAIRGGHGVRARAGTSGPPCADRRARRCSDPRRWRPGPREAALEVLLVERVTRPELHRPAAVRAEPDARIEQRVAVDVQILGRRRARRGIVAVVEVEPGVELAR